MNTKPLATGFQEPTYIEEVLDDELEETRQKFLHDVDMVRKCLRRKSFVCYDQAVAAEEGEDRESAEKCGNEMRTSFQALLNKRPCN
uniref:Uncharacterized protein n=1 Tax=Ditylenchus dipsaci TaxID=166011 RepID=A0A915EBJ1_9BILA